MCFYSPSGVVDQIVPALAGVGDPRGAVLRQIPVPPNMLGRQYSELFRNLTLSHGLVPLGLYRAKGGANGALSFVHTAPPPDTILKEGDKVFLLRPCVSKRNGKSAAGAAAGAQTNGASSPGAHQPAQSPPGAPATAQWQQQAAQPPPTSREQVSGWRG